MSYLAAKKTSRERALRHFRTNEKKKNLEIAAYNINCFIYVFLSQTDKVDAEIQPISACLSKICSFNCANLNSNCLLKLTQAQASNQKLTVWATVYMPGLINNLLSQVLISTGLSRERHGTPVQGASSQGEQTILCYL